MGLARRLQPQTSDRAGSVERVDTELLDAGVDGGWDEVEAMVALLSWDALGDALAAGSSDLRDAWLTLTSVASGAHLIVVRACLLVARAHHTEHLALQRVGFVHGRQPGEWVRQVEPGDLQAAARVLKGPLEVAHPRLLRFNLRSPEPQRLRLLFGPLREQRRRPPAMRASSQPSAAEPPCRRCGQPLVDPQSRARGYGPDCWKATRRD